MEMTLDEEAMKEAEEIWEKDLESNFKIYVNNCLEEAFTSLKSSFNELSSSVGTYVKEEKSTAKKNPFSLVHQANNNEQNQQQQKTNDLLLSKNPFSLVQNVPKPQEPQEPDVSDIAMEADEAVAVAEVVEEAEKKPAYDPYTGKPLNSKAKK